MTTIFAEPLCLGYEVYEGASVYEANPVVTVELSRNGFPLGDAQFYANGDNVGTSDIFSPDGAALLADLLDLGWTHGCVDGVDFKVV